MPVRTLQERAAVVDVAVHARIRERMVGMQLLSELVQARVDLHRVDALGASGQRERDVVARSGPDDRARRSRSVAATRS